MQRECRDPRRKKLLDWRHKGKCSCPLCKWGKKAARDARRERRAAKKEARDAA